MCFKKKSEFDYVIVYVLQKRRKSKFSIGNTKLYFSAACLVI